MTSLPLILLIVMALISKPGTGHTHGSHPNKVQNHASPSVQPVPPASPTALVGTQSSSESPTDKQRRLYRKWDDPQWWAVGVNSFIALSTLGTLALLYGQVNALRNIERAFLIPVWRDELWLHPEWVNKNELRHCFLWRFKNEGKTPAFVREVYGNIDIYKTEKSIATKPIYPRERIKLYEGDPLPSRSTMDTDFWVGIDGESAEFDDTKNLYRTEGQVLFAYGIVRYEDMFGAKHETRFGLIYHPDPESTLTGKWQIGGPKQYNNYT